MEGEGKEWWEVRGRGGRREWWEVKGRGKKKGVVGGKREGRRDRRGGR